MQRGFWRRKRSSKARVFSEARSPCWRSSVSSCWTSVSRPTLCGCSRRRWRCRTPVATISECSPACCWRWRPPAGRSIGSTPASSTLYERSPSPTRNVWLFLIAVYHNESINHVFIMVALCNRADHYIFALWFLSIFFFFCLSFFPRLISAAAGWMSTILWLTERIRKLIPETWWGIPEGAISYA